MRAGRVALALGLAASGVSSVATADDTTDLEALLDESLVAGASKTPEAVSVAPAQTTVITAGELRRFGIHTLEEALNFLSSGIHAENPHNAAEVGARGVLITQDYGAHVLLLIDGHALNEVWGGAAYFERGAGIPFELIDSIEVIVGPGSVLYGSNAMLGVINVITKRARDHRGLNAVVESEILPGHEGVPGWSLRAGAGAGIEFELFGEKGELTFQGEHYTLEGPAFRFGPQNYGVDTVTGLPRRFSDETPAGVWGGVADRTYFQRAPSGYARVVLGDFRLAMRAALFERSKPYHGGDFDDPENYELDRWLSLDASYRTPLGSRAQLLARLYGDLYDYQQYYPASAPEECLEGQDQGCVYHLLGTAKWMGLEVNSSFDWLGDGRFSTLVGVDGRVKNVGSLSDSFDLVSGESGGAYDMLDETELALGAYVQQTMQPVRALGFNAGARVDVDQRYGAYASPRFAVTLSPWKGGALKAIYSKAFRAPTAFERYYAEPTSQIQNPDLTPEVVRGIEGSFEQRVGTHRLEAGVFHSSVQDLVFTQALTGEEIAAAIDRGELVADTPSADQIRNAASIDSFGFTARIQGSLLSGKLSYAASVTRARARRSDPGVELPFELAAAASWFGNARISYDFAEGRPVIGLAARFVGERLADAPDSSGSTQSAPADLELRGTLSGPVADTGIGYRVSGGYSFASRLPYAVGPAYLDDGKVELAPASQVRVAVGLSYTIAP